MSGDVGVVGLAGRETAKVSVFVAVLYVAVAAAVAVTSQTPLWVNVNVGTVGLLTTQLAVLFADATAYVMAPFPELVAAANVTVLPFTAVDRLHVTV